jgi:hypothetical protein
VSGKKNRPMQHFGRCERCHIDRCHLPMGCFAPAGETDCVAFVVKLEYDPSDPFMAKDHPDYVRAREVHQRSDQEWRARIAEKRTWADLYDHDLTSGRIWSR